MMSDAIQHHCSVFAPRFGKIALGWALLLLAVSTARAEHLPVKTYTVADGLLRDSIFKIRQDSRGFLWICTAEGVSRFDGAGMTNFTVADGLPDRFATDFLETRDGTIYIATGKGLARLNPRGLRASKENPLFNTFLPDNPKAERILSLFEDKSGRVWVGTSAGLYRLAETGGRHTLVPVALGESPDKALHVTEIIEDRHGFIWVGTSQGLFHIAPNGEARHLTSADGLAQHEITSLLEDDEGRLWAGFRHGGGLCRLDAQTLEVKKCFSEKDGLPSAWVTDLRQTGDGKIWVATVSGLCLWQGEAAPGRVAKSVCKTYSEKNDLCFGISTLAEDRDGNLWTGSGCGAKKIARYGFTTYNEEDGLHHLQANSIFENRAGELFVSNNPISKRKISRFDGDKFSTLEPRLSQPVNYFGWGWQQTVWHDSAGAWWIPSGAGVFRTPPATTFEDLARTTAEKEIDTKGKEIFRLFEDSRGDVWIGFGGGGVGAELWRWERAADVWHNYTSRIAMTPDREISAFAEDRAGSVWIGTGSDNSVHYYEGLLIRYRDGQFQRFTEREGVPRGWTRDLFFDSRARLWIASTEDGLFRLDDPQADDLQFVRYSPANGLTSNATTSVTEDEFGRIYVGTWRGIDRLTPDTGQIENFTSADGLRGSYVETAYRDRNNNLWFATPNGLARFQPEPPRQRKPPTILITGLRVEGDPQPVSILGETQVQPLELDSDQNQIGVDFLGLGASLGEKLRYEYRLENSADWTLTAERSLNFANLAPGAYSFEVRASTADGIYSSAPAVMKFEIAVPLWRRWWFMTLTALVLALAIYAVYRSRVRRLLEIERTRTRIATDLHDDIGTNLSKISLLSEIVNLQLTGGDERNRQMLASIAEISRESVASMSDIVWAINPHRDSMRELISRMREHAEEIFVEKGVRVLFDAPAADEQIKLSMDTRRDLYLIFKEAIANAAKHSACRRIEINLDIRDGRIFLQIGDDGRGFDMARRRDGNGLENMRRRAESNGGKLEVESKLGGGTRIELELPQG